ncbi:MULTISPECIES: FtsX-like permease family protein [Vagococcus]|uniref:ABC transporter permease protein n=1 Tax=Vagococcus fluvialis bH819 TaxID=1255619 RepID=A0A1X6WPA9_9ENTE|nr:MULTISPECIES: FtsX-like permease family protein [Vagococcus]SLM86098.1 ABC transporter permease protein [Vagococcus fluvialis bH819]HCM90347.1 hypothetical protein [Vagococcus sp.]
MMLSKLAVKNVKTQFKYYFMYFVSMVFSVMVYYSFVSMSFDEELIKRAASDMRIDTGLRAGSIMIILFIIIFMFSANTFFVKRRKREIGLYNLLGMRKSQIGTLFFVENMILGILSLISGIILGIIFSKLFAMLLLKAIQVPVSSHFIFSFKALINTVVVFLVILALVSVRTAATVYRYKLITLFKAEQQSEGSLVIRWYNWLFGLSGVLLLITGYFLANNFFRLMVWSEEEISLNGMGILIFPLVILFICVFGTYLFFGHFLGIMLNLTQKIKSHYYKDLNMITTGNLSFHLKKNAMTFATIAVLSGTALASIGGAASVQSFSLGLADAANPTTYSVDDAYYEKLKQFLKNENQIISDENYVEFKYVGGKFNYKNNSDKNNEATFYNVMSLSRYESIQKMIPTMESLKINKEKDVSLLMMSINQAYIESDTFFEHQGILGNIGIVNVTDVQSDFIGNSRDMRLPYNVVVVTDELYKKIESNYTYRYHIINVKNADKNEALAQASLKEFGSVLEEKKTFIAATQEIDGKMVDTFDVLKEPVNKDKQREYRTQNRMSIRYPYYSSLVKSTGLLIYVAVFLGVIFMIATGSIITLKQLSEAEEESDRYDMLRKLGTPRAMIKKSIYKQNFIIFFAPLFISLLHTYFALKVLFVLIGVPKLLLTYVSVVFLIIIYIIFYFATSSSYNKIVS